MMQGPGWAGNADGSTRNGAATVVSFVAYFFSVRRLTRWPSQVNSHPPRSLAVCHQGLERGLRSDLHLGCVTSRAMQP
jgi:hypothetical protein